MPEATKRYSNQVYISLEIKAASNAAPGHRALGPALGKPQQRVGHILELPHPTTKLSAAYPEYDTLTTKTRNAPLARLTHRLPPHTSKQEPRSLSRPPKCRVSQLPARLGSARIARPPSLGVLSLRCNFALHLGYG
jgi:hypothetical protein